MATSASIIKAWQDGQNAHLAVSVVGDFVLNGQALAVEYIGTLPLSSLQGLTVPQIRAALVAAVQAERARSQALSQPQQTDLGLSGQVLI